MGTIKQTGQKKQAGRMLRSALKNTAYYQRARAYIEKLIRIQAHLEKKNYLRTDQCQVKAAIAHLRKYLNYYRYDSDEKMRGFFARNQQQIRTLIPHRNYPGYQKLMTEFSDLQNQ